MSLKLLSVLIVTTTAVILLNTMAVTVYSASLKTMANCVGVSQWLWCCCLRDIILRGFPLPSFI